MTQHILIEKAVKTMHRETPEMPSGLIYDSVSGYWRDSARRGQRALTQMMTKKNDIETGEDMKGT